MEARKKEICVDVDVPLDINFPGWPSRGKQVTNVHIHVPPTQPHPGYGYPPPYAPYYGRNGPHEGPYWREPRMDPYRGGPREDPYNRDPYRGGPREDPYYRDQNWEARQDYQMRRQPPENQNRQGPDQDQPAERGEPNVQQPVPQAPAPAGYGQSFYNWFTRRSSMPATPQDPQEEARPVIPVTIDPPSPALPVMTDPSPTAPVMTENQEREIMAETAMETKEVVQETQQIAQEVDSLERKIDQVIAMLAQVLPSARS
jgi:hypothetical protein